MICEPNRVRVSVVTDDYDPETDGYVLWLDSLDRSIEIDQAGMVHGCDDIELIRDAVAGWVDESRLPRSGVVDMVLVEDYDSGDPLPQKIFRVAKALIYKNLCEDEVTR